MGREETERLREKERTEDRLAWDGVRLVSLNCSYRGRAAVQHCNSATERGSLTFIKRAPAIDFMAGPRAGWVWHL